MEVYLSRHARNRMRKFRVSAAEVRLVLEQPEMREAGDRGRQNAWRNKGDRYIRVTYVEEEARTVVVTVTLKDRLPGGVRE